MDGVEDVESGLDQVGQQSDDRTAGVDKGLPGGVGVHPVVDAAVKGHVEVTVGPGGDERPFLGAKVGAGDKDGAHAVADGVVQSFEVGQAEVALALEYLVDIVAADGGADVPLGYVADTLGVLEPGRGHEGDVAKGGAAKVGEDGLVGLVVETQGLALKVG